MPFCMCTYQISSTPYFYVSTCNSDSYWQSWDNPANVRRCTDVGLMLGQRHRLGQSLVRWTYSAMRVSKSDSLIALTDSLPSPRAVSYSANSLSALGNYILTATSSKITSPDSDKKSITADYLCYPTFVSDNRYHCGDWFQLPTTLPQGIHLVKLPEKSVIACSSTLPPELYPYAFPPFCVVCNITSNKLSRWEGTLREIYN